MMIFVPITSYWKFCIALNTLNNQPMYRILLFFLCLAPILASAQLKKLKVHVTENFQPSASITVEQAYDPLMVSQTLTNSLVSNGFKVLSYRTAQERAEKINKGEITDSSWMVSTSKGKTTYIKAVYVITISYQYRSDTGCGGNVVSNLSGQVVDLANDGEIVATFSFSQGMLEGKCISKITDALAEALSKGK